MPKTLAQLESRLKTSQLHAATLHRTVDQETTNFVVVTAQHEERLNNLQTLANAADEVVAQAQADVDAENAAIAAAQAAASAPVAAPVDASTAPVDPAAPNA